MPVSKDYLPIAGASGQTTGATVFSISQSIRFDQDNTGHMQRTPSGASNRRTFTFSAWLKHTHKSTNGYHNIFCARADASNYFELAKEVAPNGNNRYDVIDKTSGSTSYRLQTNAHFNDEAAWYHLVCVSDTTNALSTNRVRLYVNGIRMDSFNTQTYPSADYQSSSVNTTVEHEIGAFNGGAGYGMDGYMAEINFVDGLALGPENFGEFNAHDFWIPIEYSGSYGTNGFHIDGRDSSDLGDDESGNGNDFSVTNISSHDQVLDSPTNNWCTMNSKANPGGATLAEGNLKATMASGTKKGVYSTIGLSSGKWYVEGRLLSDNTDSPYAYVGIEDYNSAIESGQYIGRDTYGYSYDPANGAFLYNNSNVVSSLPSVAQGDIIQIAVDLDNNAIYWGKNGTFLNSGDPTSGSSKTGGVAITAASSQPSGHYHIGHSNGTGSSGYQSSIQWNFGQDGTFAGGTTAGGNTDADGQGNFKYSVPTGYRAIRVANIY